MSSETPTNPAPDRPILIPVPAATPFVAMPGMIDAAAKRHPGKVALASDGERIVWGDFHRAISRVAAGLAQAGIGRGDRVAILAPTVPAYLEVFLGALRAGACAVPLPTLSGDAALDAILADCSPAAILVVDEYRDLLAAARLPSSLALRLALDFDAPGWTGYLAWRDRQTDTPPPVAIAPGDPFNIIYSSGTTGSPKGIEQSHLMRSQHCVRMARLGLDAEARAIVSTPLYSNTTLVAALPTLAAGGGLVLMRRFDVAGFLDLCEREAVTHAMLVPVQYRRILEHPAFDRADLSSFRGKFSTSAPFEPALLARVLERWPGRMVSIYGLTEGGVTAVLDATARPDKLDTVGLPPEGGAIAILGEDGTLIAAGEIGEIVGRATAVMTGYYRRRDLTEATVWRDADGLAWLRTGDLGFLDDEGFLHLVGRRKDMIISGGFNIYPADLEVVLSAHPAVAEAAVVGVPSDRWGETPLGFVVPGNDAAADPQAILDWANSRLGKLQRLAGIEIVAELPRSSIGKVLKRELAQSYLDGRRRIPQADPTRTVP
jgi:acyl-CoA synthetase (AMP-forming)/AMP-acid ligase II